jgi:hypothetical protein
MNTKFKVISTGRFGTLALNRYIHEYSQISLPNYKETRDIFRSHGVNIADLLNDSSEQSTRQGVIIHGSNFFDKLYRKRLLKLNNIKVNCILHLVRNPYEQAKSWINHINACAAMGVLNWQKIPTSAEEFYASYPESFNTMKAGLQCRTLYKNHKKIKILDFPSLASSNIDQTMADIYDFLGVDNSYRNEIFHQSQSLYTRVLLIKGIAFRLNNEVIEMCKVPVDLYYRHKKNVIPWVTIQDIDEMYKHCPTVPKLDGDLIFLPKNNDVFNNLSARTKTMLHEGIADIVSEVLLVWAKNAEATSQQIEENKPRALSEAGRDFVAKTMKDDLNIFCRYHPEFKTLWDL